MVEWYNQTDLSAQTRRPSPHLTSVEIGPPNRCPRTLEPGGYRWAGGRVAALLGFDLWLAGRLVVIGPLVAVGPSFYTFLASLVWQPPVPSKGATAP